MEPSKGIDPLNPANFEPRPFDRSPIMDARMAQPLNPEAVFPDPGPLRDACPQHHTDQKLFLPMEVQWLGGDKVHVKCCSCCGQEHPSAVISELRAPSDPYTHYFLCKRPDGTHDPILITLAVKTGEAFAHDPELLEAIATAAKSGKWMAAVWWIGPPVNPQKDARPGLYMKRFVRHLPTDDFRGSIEMLAENLQVAVGAVPKPPLKPATIPRAAALNLFPGANIPEGVEQVGFAEENEGAVILPGAGKPAGG